MMNKNKIVRTIGIERGGFKCVITATKKEIESGYSAQHLQEIIDTLSNKIDGLEKEDAKHCKCICQCKKCKS